MQMKLKAIEISYKSFRYECLLNETFFEIFKQKPDKLHLSFQIKCHEKYVLKKHEYRKDYCKTAVSHGMYNHMEP